jgi:serine/threonine protein kinase
MTSDQSHDTVVIKAVLNHPRVKNEADFLKLYQNRSPHLRPLVDEIIEPHNYPTIALRHLDDDLLNASIDRALNRQEMKHVSRCVLEALEVLHEDGIVHTGMSLCHRSHIELLICLPRCQARQRVRKLQTGAKSVPRCTTWRSR